MASARISIGSSFDPKGLEQAQKSVGNFTKKSGEQFKDFANKASLAFVALGAGAVLLGKKLIDAGEQASTSNARIEQIADSMGLFTKEMIGVEGGAQQVTKRLVALANATARATGVDQNAIKATQAKLLTFRELAQTADEAGAQFDRATMAAIDLAAAGFGSAESNAVQLGKALQDPIKGLSALARSGVTFSEAEKERIQTLVESNQVGAAQALILEAIESQVGGTARATSNASDRMSVAFSQLREGLGLQLLPVFERFVSFIVEKVMPAVERFGNMVIGELTVQIDRLQQKLGPIIDQLGGFLGPIIEKITTWMKNNTETVKVFFMALAGAAVILMLVALALKIAALFNPITLIIIGLAALVAAFKHAWDNSERFREVMTRVFDVVKTIVEIAIKFIMNWFDALKTTIMGWVKIIRGIFTGDLRMVLDGMKEAFSGAIKMVIQMFIGMPKAIWDVLGPKLLQFGKDIVGNIVDGIKSTASNIGSAILGAIPGMGAITGAIGKVGGLLGFRDGGLVPGPVNSPMPILAHGGEFVLSADIVDAIRRGGASRGLDAEGVGAAPSGPSVVIENYTAIERQDDEMLIGMLEFAVRGGRL